MNSFIAYVFQALRVVFITVAGLIALNGCGGGGGGGGGGSVPTADPLEITAANAEDVAGLVVETIYSSFDLAGSGSDSLTDGSASASALAIERAVAQPLRQQSAGVGIQAAFGPITEPCLVSGEFTLSGNLANPATISVGDRLTIDFAACDDGDGAILDGQLQLVIRGLQGNPFSDIFLLRADVTLNSFAVTEGGETVSADGNSELTLDTTDYPVGRTRLAGGRLQVGLASDVLTFTDIDQTEEINVAVLPYSSLITASGSLASRVLDGRVDFTTPVPVAGASGDAPDTGEILITGLNDATIRVVVTVSDEVELRLDLDGDGTVDEIQLTTWEALGGAVAPGVTRNNAEALVGEALAAVAQFELALHDAGAQFSDGVFQDALSLIAVPGPFGPVSPRCSLSSGSVAVTGQLAVPGTFTAGDVFAASFNDCWLGYSDPLVMTNKLVNGELSTLVTAYSGIPGASSVEFEADAMGYGGASGSYTAGYSEPDPSQLGITGTSSAVQLHGPVARALYDFDLTSDVRDFGASTVTRSFAGDFYTARVTGRFNLETLAPVEDIVDDDTATGPFVGEWLITADNGSSVNVIPQGFYGARLDVDLDGNGSIDESNMVMYSEMLVR